MMAAMFTVPINNPVGLDLFSYVATITDKSFGTLKHFWGIFQLTQAPSPHPTNNVRCMYPEFFPSFNIA